MLWDQYKTAANDRMADPGPGGWWYHHAPTTDRARIQQHGLVPSNPNLNDQWGEISSQPHGVYLFNSPSTQPLFTQLNERVPLDQWRVPAEGLEVHPDPIVWENAVYSPQHIPNPELFRPYEKSNEYQQLYGQPEEQYHSGPVPEDWVNYHDRHELGNPSDAEWQSYGIGQPTETWRQAARIPAVVPGKGGIMLKELGVPGWEKYQDRSAFLYYPQSNAVILGQPGQHHSDLLGEYERLSDKFEPYYGQVWHREGETPSFEHFIGEQDWDPSPVYQALQRKWPDLQQIEGEYHGTYSSRRKSISTPMGWGDMYHVSPRKNRDRILQEGLQGQTGQESPWTLPWNQPKGNYVFDNPEDAKDYIYTLHKGDFGNEFEYADPEPPEEYDEWPEEQQEEWMNNYYENPSQDDQNGYDIWRVNARGLPMGTDPESELARQWNRANPPAHLQPNDEWEAPWDLGRLHEWGEDWGQLGAEHGEEPKRYHVPIGVQPNRLQLHEHVPSWNLTEEDSENRQDNSYERQVPTPWMQTPMTEWPLPGHDEPAPPGIFSSWQTMHQADLYHVSPTIERNRIKTWGLQPANPYYDNGVGPEGWEEAYGPDFIPPTGVYGFPSPEQAREWGIRPWSEPLDIWRFPGEGEPDPDTDGAYYVPHAVEPTLHEGPEHRMAGTSPKPWEAKMWHGKPASRGLMGPVRCPFWSTSAQEEAHGMAGDGGSVHPVSVRFHNPAHFFANANWGPESLELARQSGHDGAVVHWPGQIDDPANPQPPRKWAIALDPGAVVPGHLQDSYDSGV